MSDGTVLGLGLGFGLICKNVKRLDLYLVLLVLERKPNMQIPQKLAQFRTFFLGGLTPFYFDFIWTLNFCVIGSFDLCKFS